ncbi:TPA: hypothetical protein KOX39_003437 [Clostridioides difficile]|nr:hypothetical protein [Clostridioides difficile]
MYELVIINNIEFYRHKRTCKLFRKYKDIGRWSDWLLRLESDNFIMVVNKHTGEYRNIYADYFMGDARPLKYMALLLDHHKNYRS